jgi:FtsX-like permease family
VRSRAAGVVRRISFPLRFAGRRVAAARRPLAIAAFGVALASCALAAALAASAIVENRAVTDAIDELPPAERDVDVTWVGLTSSPSERLAVLDRQARAALGSVGLVPSTRTLAYRDTRRAGQVVRFAAVDGLPNWFVLSRGRAPRACSPTRCETVAVGNGPVPSIPGLPVVGVAEPRPGTPARRLLGTATAGVRPLVAEGVAGAARLATLESVFHSYTWSAPLESARPTAWTLNELEQGLTRAETGLQAASARFGLSAPVDRLDDVALDARVAYRRLLLVGSECAVLFLVFAVVAASSLRSSARSASRRLRRFGASRWQTDLLALAEATAIVVPAVVLGWAAGALVAALLAAATDTPLWPLLERKILSPTGLALAAALAALAVLILFATSRAQPVSVRGRGLSLVDVAAGAALLAVAVALAVGQTDAESLARDRGTGIVLLLVPGLLIVAGAILAARLAGPAFRLAERVAPRTRPSLRLALLSAARNPGTQLVVVGFLVVSVGLAVFAATYRSTLLEGERAEAAFAVPLDYTVREAGRGTGEPSIGAAYARWNAVPVIRRTGQAPSLNLTTTIDVLGVPSDALERLRWRSDFAATGPEELGRRIAPPRPSHPVGPRLPTDAVALSVPVTVLGDSFVATANVRTEGGTYLPIDLGEARRGRNLLRAQLPPAARNGTLVGLSLEMPPAEAVSAAHATGEGAAPDVFSVGRLAFEQPSVSTPRGSRPVPVDYREWVAATEASPAASPVRNTLRIRYQLTRERAFRLRPRQPTDGSPLPVIACDSLAERVGGGGVVPLSLGAAVVNARTVGQASLFPTLRCPFVVADAGVLETAVNAAAPGAAVADEAWIARPPGLSGTLERASGGIPVSVTSRRAVEAELRDDPLARGTVAVLAAGGLVALVLAVLAVLLVVSVELRDESGDFYDLESQGMAPATLRRQLLQRIGSLTLFGVLCGLVTGAVLTAVVTKLVAVGAGAADPMPPLRLHVAWPEVALGLLGLALVLGVTLSLVTRRAFAGPLPARSGEVR